MNHRGPGLAALMLAALTTGTPAQSTPHATVEIPHEFHTWPGAHEWRAWRAHAGASLAWLVRRVTAGP